VHDLTTACADAHSITAGTREASCAIKIDRIHTREKWTRTPLPTVGFVDAIFEFPPKDTCADIGESPYERNLA
jgi:hypothetical protein